MMTLLETTKMDINFIEFKVVMENPVRESYTTSIRYVSVSQIKEIKILGDNADVYLLDSKYHFPHFTAEATDSLRKALGILSDPPLFVYTDKGDD